MLPQNIPVPHLPATLKSAFAAYSKRRNPWPSASQASAHRRSRFRGLIDQRSPLGPSLSTPPVSMAPDSVKKSEPPSSAIYSAAILQQRSHTATRGWSRGAHDRSECYRGEPGCRRTTRPHSWSAWRQSRSGGSRCRSCRRIDRRGSVGNRRLGPVYTEPGRRERSRSGQDPYNRRRWTSAPGIDRRALDRN
jgi:hypothetical protein